MVYLWRPLCCCKAACPNIAPSPPENESVVNFSPLCGPAEKGTQIALLSRPRQEAIICALLNLLFFFIQSAHPFPLPKSIAEPNEVLWNSVLSYGNAHVSTGSPVDCTSSFIQCFHSPVTGHSTVKHDNEETFANTFPSQQIEVAKCTSEPNLSHTAPSLLTLNQDSDWIEYQMQRNTWTWTIALVLLATII